MRLWTYTALALLALLAGGATAQGWDETFDGKALDARWTWRAQVHGPTYSLAERPGWLRIHVPQRQQGYNHWNEPAPLDEAPQLRAAPLAGDWVLDAHIQLQQLGPSSHFMAGLMVGFSDTKLLCFGPFQAPDLPGGPKQPEAWLEPTGQSGYAQVPGPARDVTLRITRAGTSYRASLRRADGEWVDAGAYTCADAPRFVGIIGKTFSPGDGIAFDVGSVRLSPPAAGAAPAAPAAPQPEAAATAHDWPHRRGPGRQGITAESSGWEQGAWPLSAPVWQQSVGQGGTSPIMVGGRLYTMGWHDGRDSVFCLDAATGRQVWVQSYRAPRFGRYATGDQDAYSGPSSTPAFDPATGLLYTLGIDGDLSCWNSRAGGARVWGTNLHTALGVPQRPSSGGGVRDYGYTSSPMIWADQVIVEVGSPQGTLVAFDKRTGARRWASQCKDPAGQNAGPQPMAVAGIPCVVDLTLRRLLVARLDAGHEGQTLATYDWQTDWANNIATPTVVGDSVLLTSGYNIGKTVRLRISPGGVERVWESRDYSKVASPVVSHGCVYLAWQRLVCLDPATGQRKWSGGVFSDDGSCLATGDGRLVVCGNGRVALVEGADRSPGAYRELSVKKDLGLSRCWPHPALAGGRLYVKDRDGRVACFALTAPR